MPLARRTLCTATIVLLAACHEATAPDTRGIPTGVTAVTATTLAGTVGSPIQPTPTVRVVNSAGEPIANIDVHFAVSAGSGTVQGATVRTDAQGTATVGSWTMGTVAGVNSLFATVAALPAVQFSATASPGPATALALVSGDAQSDTIRATLSPIVLKATDAFGNVVPDATVEATIAADAGTIAAVPNTGSDGQTKLKWTLGSAPGPQTARVQLKGLVSTALLLHATTRWPQIVGPALAVGYNHNCALLENRRLFCWGDNDYGQIGDGTKVDRPVAVAVGDGIAFAQVAAGGVHTCALTTAGQTLCWGANRWRQLGDGTTVDHVVPTPVIGVPAFTQLVAGAEHMCGRTEAGEVYCWGFLVGAVVAPAPILVSGTSHFRSIATGSFRTCGIDDAGVTQCFSDAYPNWRPQPVANAPKLVALAGGLDFMCGITEVGAAYCWGGNMFGQLGTGTTDSSATPVAVAGGRAFRSIHAGYDFACGVTLIGETYCWGHNSWGVMGVDGQPYTYPSPVRLVAPAGTTFTSMAGGFYHMCAIATTSQVLCWAAGFDGQLGDDGSRVTDEFHHRPTPAPALRH